MSSEAIQIAIDVAIFFLVIAACYPAVAGVGWLIHAAWRAFGKKK